ncbi:Nab6p KNAG_0G03440 [Huiozyma naganishii CBS 8797]|uniref:RRM domain-containing protein n=1 Tax=Huiozyma naganishii (strain ATCC MYA-139 / BCRC 22969 / CBS 8797 / KCTC 17520 / NBRC 10181 / NCYC 3082 / Yp74L-3) TaxID=1071383 RepID=J7S1C8_HUIN7|nr:hypothetical protein KNAG_0G03440 [Kazachstania naganishii CBS 8797]CCK71402.1 hypothetical protein KNAG_0G03440 [Kazachstania naganishii CBS 8797]
MDFQLKRNNAQHGYNQNHPGFTQDSVNNRDAENSGPRPTYPQVMYQFNQNTHGYPQGTVSKQAPLSQQSHPFPQNFAQNFPPNSPMTNGMPTPFDTAYGATLLPSHLLMGSPFVSTPNLPQTNYTAQRKGSHTGMANGTGSMNYYRTDPQIINGLFQIPFEISYKILPKGDDLYRTRSLLLGNIDDMVDLHTFVSKFVQNNSVESVYITKEGQQPEKYGFLLSFLSVQICLNFYNNVLQRLKEFKEQLKASSLELSFVSMRQRPTKVEGKIYRRFAADDGDGMANLHFDMAAQTGATRSIAIEFVDKDVILTRDELLNKKLKFLSEGNNRYILEHIAVFKTQHGTKVFGKNYAIITFLSIPMAMEIMDYLKLNIKQLHLTKFFYVQVTHPPQQSPAASQKKPHANDTESNRDTSPPNSKKDQEFFPNNSMLSLVSSESSTSLADDVDGLVNKLKSIELQESTLKLRVEDYPEPLFEQFSEHSNGIVQSLPVPQTRPIGGPQSSISTPRAFGAFPNDIGSPPASFLPLDLNHSNSVPNLPPGFIPATPSGPMSPQQQQLFLNSQRQQRDHAGGKFAHPITDSLESQMKTSTQVATAMGSDFNNRTIYIGNINPRSRAEDICNVVRGGILQNIKFIEAKHICFITFIEASAAVQFYANAFIDPIVLHGNTLKLGWGTYTGPLPKPIALAVTIGASRNVYISLPEIAFKDKYIKDPKFKIYHESFKLPAKEVLRKDFLHYGSIEQINMLNDSHCCWVNFMNISSAIRLVEDASTKQDHFNQLFDHRYEGLVINYGKDRCGNINRNLVAGKTSKYHKKVKKHTRDVRLSQLEEKRRNQDAERREMVNGTIPEENPFDAFAINTGSAEKKDELSLDSLGISIMEVESASPISPVMGDLEDHTNGSYTDAGIAPLNYTNNSGSSSDIELIINPPNDPNRSVGVLEGDPSTLSPPSDKRKLVALHEVSSPPPPLAPDTISRQYAEASYHNELVTGNDHPDTGYGKAENGRHRQQLPRNARTIPGSDVMAQYLAQLQHSTFMYAANVLGASNEGTEQYDDQ